MIENQFSLARGEARDVRVVRVGDLGETGSVLRQRAMVARVIPRRVGKDHVLRALDGEHRLRARHVQRAHQIRIAADDPPRPTAWKVFASEWLSGVDDAALLVPRRRLDRRNGRPLRGGETVGRRLVVRARAQRRELELAVAWVVENSVLDAVERVTRFEHFRGEKVEVRRRNDRMIEGGRCGESRQCVLEEGGAGRAPR